MAEELKRILSMSIDFSIDEINDNRNALCILNKLILTKKDILTIEYILNVNKLMLTKIIENSIFEIIEFDNESEMIHLLEKMFSSEEELNSIISTDVENYFKDSTLLEESLKDYGEREFNSPIELKNSIELAYTQIEEDENGELIEPYSIQSILDLPKLKILTFKNNKIVDECKYNSVKKLAEGFGYISFDDLVRI